jgi:hypothetical protein
VIDLGPRQRLGEEARAARALRPALRARRETQALPSPLTQPLAVESDPIEPLSYKMCERGVLIYSGEHRDHPLPSPPWGGTGVRVSDSAFRFA